MTVKCVSEMPLSQLLTCISEFLVLKHFYFVIFRSRFSMATSRSKQTDVNTRRDTHRTKKSYDSISHHPPVKNMYPIVADDEYGLISTHQSSYARFSSSCLLSQRKRKASLETASSGEYTNNTSTLPRRIKYHRAGATKLPEESTRRVGEEKCADTEWVKFPTATVIDLVTRDEIVQKLSIFVALYGNFVVIPTSTETLRNATNAIKNIKLEYWSDVMAFIDSYDLSSTSVSVKNLIDDLANEITHFVEAEGIVSGGWQKILCTLPDDTTRRLDYRLKKEFIEEIESLANADQLPFDLSQPMRQLLVSAKKRAAEYIRSD